jgi:peptidoglycan lytic transglycosylase A
MSKATPGFEPVAFEEISGWAGDDHLSAFRTFLRSCGPVLAGAASSQTAKSVQPSKPLLRACEVAKALGASDVGAKDARAFFEENFQPHRLIQDQATGLLTGYYEPVLDGARVPGHGFEIPVYRRPRDLVNLVAESERGAMAHALTHGRKTPSGVEPYATRADIDNGALHGQGLELLWLADPVDAFFMHVQGSGRIRFADGQTVGITYDGKNGHPYTSIGRYLIDEGLIDAEEMSLGVLKDWLTENAGLGRSVMQKNLSYVFFREVEPSEADGPLGVLGIPLTDGRSLAVDTAYHPIGSPIFVTAPTLTHGGQPEGFKRLMIAQDVGSAIRGPERGDVYFGSGEAAGGLAGITKHPGSFTVLIARDRP